VAIFCLSLVEINTYIFNYLLRKLQMKILDKLAILRKFILFILIPVNCIAATSTVTISENQFEQYHGGLAPQIEFFDQNNNQHTLEEFEGKVLVVSFWASWCTICNKDMPELDKLQKDFRKKPLKVIAISEDFKGIDAVKSFYSANKIQNLEIFVDRKFKLFEAFQVVGLPTSFLIDKDGNIVAKAVSAVDWGATETHELLNQYLSGIDLNNSEKILDNSSPNSQQPSMMIKVTKPSPPSTTPQKESQDKTIETQKEKDLPKEAITTIPSPTNE
jgi:thiol-disulfide isomerase/thioredoxin